MVQDTTPFIEQRRTGRSRVIRRLLIAVLAVVVIGAGVAMAVTLGRSPVSASDVCTGPWYPSPQCTGVAAGAQLLTLEPNEDDTAYRVRTPGTVLDGVHIRGDLLITADDVTVRNSQIDGSVNAEYSGVVYPFTISDSTIGPHTGCITSPGVGVGEYTATRVHIRNHGDGFRVSGDNVLIQDSYVNMCSNAGGHADGVQDYTGGTNVVVRHNTFDQRSAQDYTAPIFIQQSREVIVEDNLLAGGTYTLRVKNTLNGAMTVRNNKVVDQTWAYGPTDIDCATVDFMGNELVRIDDSYSVTSILGPIQCPS